jgi:hypothetical protein
MATASSFTIDTSEPDLTELADFFAAQTGDSSELILERLQWQMRNPSRRPDVPFAWCVRTAGGTVGGAMLCIPHRLIRGPKQCTALMSSGFYVDASFRGAGMGLFLRYRALSERYVLYATTANAHAARLWQWAGAKALAETDYELLWPTRWSSLVEEMLVRRLGVRSAPLVRAVAPLANVRGLASWNVSVGELIPVHSPEDAVISSTDEGLQPVRDAAFIRWRFFDAPQAQAQIFRYRDEKLSADGFVALTRVRRGYRKQIRTLFLADMWGRIPPRALPNLLHTIRSRYRRTDDVLSIRCLRQPHLKEALETHCVRREFGCTTGWYIDRTAMLGPDPVLIPTATTELV